MLVAETSAHGLGLQPLVGAEGFKRFHRAICALLRDTDLVLDHHIEAGGWLAALCTFTGTSANGQRVAMNGAIHARIADGRIQEAYNHFDFIGLFMQLGLLPGDTFERCIAGQPTGKD
jgi:SnoaL-like polyketide cyclase